MVSNPISVRVFRNALSFHVERMYANCAQCAVQVDQLRTIQVQGLYRCPARSSMPEDKAAALVPRKVS